jgi:hypothetical protein
MLMTAKKIAAQAGAMLRILRRCGYQIGWDLYSPNR